MLLKDKIAVIFGAGGMIGAQVARTFVREGAMVFLSGPHLGPVEKVTQEIKITGSRAEAAEVDALNEKAVEAYLDRVMKQAGKIDIVFNAMGKHLAEHDKVVVAPSTTIPYEDFLVPMMTAAASQFLTARTAVRYMEQRHSGVVIFLSATPARGVAPFIPGHSAAHGAIEGLTRSLATEWSPLGIRVVCIRPAGMLESRRIQHVFEGMGNVLGIPNDALLAAAKEKTLLKRMPTLAETAEVAAFLASDRASSITGAIINASNGEVLD